MDRLSTVTMIPGTVVGSHVRILHEQKGQCSGAFRQACFMGVEEEIDLPSGDIEMDQLSTKVIYYCTEAQRKECGDMIVEAAVKLENTRQ